MNATTCHEGQTTGEQCGKIENTSVCENVEGTTINGLVLHNALSAGGDSGGPYFGLNLKGEIMTRP